MQRADEALAKRKQHVCRSLSTFLAWYVNNCCMQESELLKAKREEESLIKLEFEMQQRLLALGSDKVPCSG